MAKSQVKKHQLGWRYHKLPAKWLHRQTVLIVQSIWPTDNTRYKHVSNILMNVLGLGLWCLKPLSTIFQLYIVDVSFIGGGNTSARRKPPTCLASHWQTLWHTVVSSTPRLNGIRTQAYAIYIVYMDNSRGVSENKQNVLHLVKIY